jgi:hypothetical protein
MAQPRTTSNGFSQLVVGRSYFRPPPLLPPPPPIDIEPLEPRPVSDAEELRAVPLE